MALSVVPHVGVGPVRLGMSGPEASAALGLPGRKMPWSDRQELFVDDGSEAGRRLSGAGLGITYDETGHCVCIGIDGSSGAEVTYEGFSLFSRPAEELLAWMRERDPAVRLHELAGTYVSRALGIALAANFIGYTSERGRIAEAVLVFAPGYYDGFDPSTEGNMLTRDDATRS